MTISCAGMGEIKNAKYLKVDIFLNTYICFGSIIANIAELKKLLETNEDLLAI